MSDTEQSTARLVRVAARAAVGANPDAPAATRMAGYAIADAVAAAVLREVGMTELAKELEAGE